MIITVRMSNFGSAFVMKKSFIVVCITTFEIWNYCFETDWKKKHCLLYDAYNINYLILDISKKYETSL
jgi:hypothetical protein